VPPTPPANPKASAGRCLPAGRPPSTAGPTPTLPAIRTAATLSSRCRGRWPAPDASRRPFPASSATPRRPEDAASSFGKKKNKQKQPGNGRWKLGNGKKTMVGAGTPSKEAAWPSGCWCDRRRRRRPTRSCGRRPKRRTVGGGPRPSSTGAASVRFQSRLIRFRASGGHGIDPISESEKGRNRSTTLVWTSSDLVQNSATRRRQRCHEEIPFPYKEMKTTLTNHEHRLNDTAPDWLPTGRAT